MERLATRAPAEAAKNFQLPDANTLGWGASYLYKPSSPLTGDGREESARDTRRLPADWADF